MCACTKWTHISHDMSAVTQNSSNDNTTCRVRSAQVVQTFASLVVVIVVGGRGGGGEGAGGLSRKSHTQTCDLRFARVAC